MNTQHEPVYTRLPVAGRSLHRWLVGIPVILYVATVVFFALYAFDDNLMWLRDGIFANLAAVIAAAVTAVPGLIDLLAIPTTSPARKLAYGHMSLMVVVLGLFVVNLVECRDVLMAALHESMPSYRGFDGTMPLALTAMGLGLAVCGGAIGLTLAIRYRVGAVSASRTTGSVMPRLR